MKKSIIRKPPTAVLIAIIAVVVAVSSAVAWLVVTPAVLDRIYSLSNYDTYADVYFWNGSSKVTPVKGSDGSITVDISNSGATNYIGKLRVDANFKGRGSAYVRLKVIQQWQDSANKILQSNDVLPYTIATPYLSSDTGNQNKWYDNRMDDYCLYYATKLTASNASYSSIPIITGMDTNGINQFNAMIPSGAVTLKIAFTLEAVQINRYPQFWGIDTLPWLPAAVTTTA